MADKQIREEQREPEHLWLEKPLAVIECDEEIPCNPCNTCCNRNAIRFEGSINSLPRLEADQCTGCGICIAKCPGMAIFVVDGSKPGEEGFVSLPYEFLPLPEEGEKIEVTNRDGETICDGVIHKVMKPGSYDHTAVVTMKLPKKYLDEARDFRLKGGNDYEG